MRVLLGVAAAIVAVSCVSPLRAAAPNADAALRAGNFSAAAAAYRAKLQTNANDASAWTGLATVDVYANDLAAANADLAHVAPADDPRVGRLRAIVAARIAASSGVSIAPGGTSIPFLQTDPLPVVRVLIDGRPANLFIDTGSPDLALDSQFVKSLGLQVTSAGVGTFAGGKHARISQTTIQSLKLGDATVAGVSAAVVSLPAHMGGYEVQGALGTGILYRFLSTLDYANGRLRLLPAQSSAQFESSAAARGANSETMWLVGSHFIFALAHVNQGPEGLFNIDTGGGGLGVQLTKASLAAAGIVADLSKAQSFQGGGGPARAIPFSADATLAGFTAKGIPGLYFPDGDQYGIFPFAVAGTLSHEFFRHTLVTFDFRAMRIVIGA